MAIKFSHTLKEESGETKTFLRIANITDNHGVSDRGGWVRNPISRFFGGYATDANLGSQASELRKYLRTNSTHKISYNVKKIS
jgi:hypothetical protein